MTESFYQFQCILMQFICVHFGHSTYGHLQHNTTRLKTRINSWWTSVVMASRNRIQIIITHHLSECLCLTWAYLTVSLDNKPLSDIVTQLDDFLITVKSTCLVPEVQLPVSVVLSLRTRTLNWNECCKLVHYIIQSDCMLMMYTKWHAFVPGMVHLKQGYL